MDDVIRIIGTAIIALLGLFTTSQEKRGMYTKGYMMGLAVCTILYLTRGI